VQIQRDAEAVESRSEVGAGRGHTHGDLVHGQGGSLAQTRARGKSARAVEFACRGAAPTAK
jgi:hypothetical protein